MAPSVLVMAVMFWIQAGLAVWLAAIVGIYLLGAASPPWRKLPARATAAWGAWLGGVALGAVGLLPLVLRRGLGAGPTWIRFADHLVYPHQLLLAGWGSGPSIAGPYDTLTFSLGLVACGLALVAFVAPHPQPLSHEERGALTPPSSYLVPGEAGPGVRFVALGVTLILVFLSTTLAAPIWRGLPFLSRLLTYPWQLLLLTGPWLAWLAGAGAKHLIDLLAPEEQAAGRVPLAAALMALALLGVYGDLKPAHVASAVGDQPVAIFGEDEIALLGITSTGTPGPGGWVTLETRWQALRPLSHDYTVFIHVETADGMRWGQQDTMPQAGELPTSRWRPGQVVVDLYRIQLKADAPIGGSYRYLVGWYQWQTGQRLSAATDDKVVVTP